jgi:hypothetical protein
MTHGRRHGRGEAGQLGGIEVLPFGFLVLVAGALLIANAWAVIDAKLAAEAGAREGARVYVEAADARDGRSRGMEAAREAVAAHGRSTDPSVLRIAPPPDASFRRCARVTWSVEIDVPALTIPFVGSIGTGPFTAIGRHSELIDPWRSGLSGTARCD